MIIVINSKVKQEDNELVEVYTGDKRIVCEAATAEEVLIHTLGSEEATVGRLLATTDGEIVGL